MTYGALSAKIRALYGKRLRADDFARLAGLKNEAELLEALRQHPGWSRALSLVPPAWSYVGRVEMEGALRDELRLEYRSLSYYVPREDKPLMQFQLRAAERSALLAALRRLKTGRYAKEPPPRLRCPSACGWTRGPWPPAPATTSSWTPPATPSTRPCSGTCAQAGTAHCPTSPWRRPPCAPPTSPTSTASSTGSIPAAPRRYFSAPWGADRPAQHHPCAPPQNLLPQTEPETYLRVLFPFHYRLNPDFTRALCAAPGVDDVFALLRDSPTGTASTAWRWARWRSTTSGPSAASTSVSSPPCPLHLHRRGVPGAQGAGAECAD